MKGVVSLLTLHTGLSILGDKVQTNAVSVATKARDIAVNVTRKQKFFRATLGELVPKNFEQFAFSLKEEMIEHERLFVHCGNCKFVYMQLRSVVVTLLGTRKTLTNIQKKLHSCLL